MENFGQKLKNAIEENHLKKASVARAAGIDASTLYRTISGEVGLSKGKQLSLIHAVNKLAGKTVFGESEDLELSPELNRLFSDLPKSVQEDILLIVRALHDRYGIENF